MADYATMFDSKWLSVADLEGADRVLVIEKVEAGMVGEGSDAERKPVIWFEGERRPFAANKTNAKAIANLYGRDTVNWIGKPIILWATTTEFAGDTVPCIRIRPQLPAANGRAGARRSHTLPIAAGKKAARR